MSALLDKIPFVPKLTKFLVCLDLYQGVRITSIGETLQSGIILEFQSYFVFLSVDRALDNLRRCFVSEFGGFRSVDGRVSVGFTFISCSGFAIWSLIWCLVTVGVYGLVIWGMQKNNRLYLLPALYMTLFNIILGIINAIINFATLAWFE